ncbi:MAG: RCC1 domain-containing protein, partial [Vicinamibacterales bacterium]
MSSGRCGRFLLDYAYDFTRRLTNVWHQHGTTTLSRHGYSLDPLGNRTQATEQLPYTGAATGFTSASGDNTFGEIGDGTTIDRITPVQSSGLNGVTMVVASQNHSLALKTDGTVWAWGVNSSGQLGVPTGTCGGTTPCSSTPLQVTGLSTVSAISALRDHSLALTTNGAVWSWGLNDAGQLGDGTTTNRGTPVQVAGADGTGHLTGMTSIAAGAKFSLAVKSDGSVWAWGENAGGQLGNDTTTNSTLPLQVKVGRRKFFTNATSVAAGQSHSLALKSDGTVWAWGNNTSGQLGDGTTTNRTLPVQVSGLTGIVAIAAGDYSSYALKSDGTVWSWGYNLYGGLGIGSYTDRNTPVQVTGLSGVTTIAAGGLSAGAKTSDGVAWAWGFNRDGSLGDGTVADQPRPVRVGVANV